MGNGMTIDDALRIFSGKCGYTGPELKEAIAVACKEIERLQRIELWYNGMREFIKP